MIIRQSPVRLIQNCGPDCMIAQRIVDKLLSRMLDLENERSEVRTPANHIVAVIDDDFLLAFAFLLQKLLNYK